MLAGEADASRAGPDDGPEPGELAGVGDGVAAASVAARFAQAIVDWWSSASWAGELRVHLRRTARGTAADALAIGLGLGRLGAVAGQEGGQELRGRRDRRRSRWGAKAIPNGLVGHGEARGGARSSCSGPAVRYWISHLGGVAELQAVDGGSTTVRERRVEGERSAAARTGQASIAIPSDGGAAGRDGHAPVRGGPPW